MVVKESHRLTQWGLLGEGTGAGLLNKDELVGKREPLKCLLFEKSGTCFINFALVRTLADKCKRYYPFLIIKVGYKQANK